MNRVYPITITICICMMVIFPRLSVAQCNCAGKDSVTQFITIDTANGPKMLITFNKFNDPTGQMYLACMDLTDTISIVSSTLVRNQSTGPIIGANFTISVTSKITGPPSINSSKSGTHDYGPYDFGPAGTTLLPSDSVILGPDTLLNKKVNSVAVTNPAPYFGIGTVSDTITFGGGAFSDAGTSFDYSIRTKYWGSARITYFLCPSIPLATAIHDFTANRNGTSVLLQWLTENEQNNTTYEIQISTDGKQFGNAGQAHGDPVTTGTTTKYQYQYNLDQANPGTVYFRVKRVDASGTVSYSAIVIVRPGGAGDDAMSYQTYPNPATNSLVFHFNTAQTGRYHLELVNTAGQVIQQRALTLTGTSELRLDLNPKPVKGMYFLRTTDLSHDHHYVSKVFIN